VAKRKLQQFAELNTFKNVFQNPQLDETIPDMEIKGNWNQNFFKNKNPIIIELGCGKGEYTVGLALNNPHLNFIGLDLKGNRIWTGAKQAIENGLNNVAFVRTRIENIRSVFDDKEVSEIWITFPDPQPTEKREKKRLSAPRYLSLYQKILKKNGLIHLKTDNRPFMEYTLEMATHFKFNILTHTFDLYSSEENSYILKHPELKQIQTYYEKLFSAKGFKINYCCFEINDNPINWVKKMS
jgi:tRNA (guanine-N7-)-methyltransferase